MDSQFEYKISIIEGGNGKVLIVEDQVKFAEIWPQPTAATLRRPHCFFCASAEITQSHANGEDAEVCISRWHESYSDFVAFLRPLLVPFSTVSDLVGLFAVPETIYDANAECFLRHEIASVRQDVRMRLVQCRDWSFLEILSFLEPAWGHESSFVLYGTAIHGDRESVPLESDLFPKQGMVRYVADSVFTCHCFGDEDYMDFVAISCAPTIGESLQWRLAGSFLLTGRIEEILARRAEGSFSCKRDGDIWRVA